MAAALLAAACRSGPPRPVDIDASDMCSFCKMAISEKRYAGEVIDAEGNAFKFDDLGCMLRFLRSKPGTAFVMDYGTGRWLAAERARYVESERIASPMASGLIAAADAGRASELARKFQGRVLSFEELRAHGR